MYANLGGTLLYNIYLSISELLKQCKFEYLGLDGVMEQSGVNVEQIPPFGEMN